MLEGLEKLREEELKALAEAETLRKEERNRLALVKAALEAYVAKAELYMDRLKQSVKNFSNEILKKIKGATGVDQFVIGGSWNPMIIQRAVSEVYEDTEHCCEG